MTYAPARVLLGMTRTLDNQAAVFGEQNKICPHANEVEPGYDQPPHLADRIQDPVRPKGGYPDEQPVGSDHDEPKDGPKGKSEGTGEECRTH